MGVGGLLYVVLGRSGLRVSRVGLGLWQAGSRLWGGVSLGDVVAAAERGLELGLNLFDTAELYGAGRSEALLGEALRRAGARDGVVVVTKVAGYRVTWAGVRKALEGSRRRLGRSPDIVLYHWPPPVPFTVCRVVRLLERAVDEGLAAYMGVSNFNARELEEAVQCTRRHEIVVDQVHYSIAHRVPENRLIPTARRLGVTVMAWGPLAKGALAGKTRADNMARRLDPVFREAARDDKLLETLRRAAEKLGVSMAVVALAWLHGRGVVPVAGVRRPRHAEEAAKAARTELPPEIAGEIDEASKKYVARWGTCYNELHWNRYIPPPLQHLIYRLILRGI
ncbi:universally conserved protein [Hyperthermus butylicus DSM 5456]|uniref:Universally conserved protein n=1 Tax=Hyperthermus butylicus (strain DSM 5456 / JCM 9403 / PLM1-5) TaxID=415426 RepID=A2BKU2_HYPBU|nr:universally conserved protein [Hyperthermus butylicus DSM 5456]